MGLDNSDFEEVTMADYVKYLDGMEEKLLDDLELVVYENNKKSSTQACFSIDKTISIDCYVNEYLEIDLNCSGLWHSGLKELKNSIENDKFKYMIAVSNDIANRNPELVEEGYLLLVMDHNGHGNRGTYINPLMIKKLNEEEDIKQRVEDTLKEHITDISLVCMLYGKVYMAIEALEEIQKIKDIIRFSGAGRKVETVLERKLYKEETKGRR